MKKENTIHKINFSNTLNRQRIGWQISNSVAAVNAMAAIQTRVYETSNRIFEFFFPPLLSYVET